MSKLKKSKETSKYPEVRHDEVKISKQNAFWAVGQFQDESEIMFSKCLYSVFDYNI